MGKPGDFFVVRTTGWMAFLIRVFTRSEWNHAGVYVGSGQIIEANPDGVKVSLLTKYDTCPQLWSDLKLTPTQSTHVVASACAQLGLGYGFRDVAAIALSTIGIRIPWLHEPNTRFCSQLVAISLKDELVFTKSVDAVTPADLARLILDQTGE